MELEPDAPLPVLMERLSVAISGWRQPFPRSKAERLVSNPMRARVALDALIVGGYVCEERLNRLRAKRSFVRARPGGAASVG
jgi:hypothetical protein